jgi:hypothetical protein
VIINHLSFLSVIFNNMALQSSGAISLNNIQTVFGGTNPIGMNEYYAGGVNVPSGTTGIPTSGTISINQFYGKSKSTSPTIASLSLSDLYNTLSTNMSSFKNPSFYEYTIDNVTTLNDGGLDMYDSGNTTQISCDGVLSGAIPYNTTTTSTVSLNGKNVGYIAMGGVTPLMMFCRSTSRAVLGFRKTGNLGADGAGLQVNDIVYNGATVSGFTVYAWRRLVYNVSDPSICDLYFMITDSSSSVFSTTMNTSVGASTDDGLSTFFMDVQNALCGCSLLSKSGGAVVSVSECQTVITNICTRISAISGGLYSFTSHTFTNASATGATGPTLAQVQSAYSGQTWAQSTTNLNVSGGIQLWTVPSTKTYTITARGARGGKMGSYSLGGGFGAIISASFSLTQGEKLYLVVGQMGNDGGTGSGGGGGSWVVRENGTLLLVAGGGGGAGHDLGWGAGGSITTSANNSSGGHGCNTTSTTGNGGGAGLTGPDNVYNYSGAGGGGAGWLSNGSAAGNGSGGIRYSSGAQGGAQSVAGGFGGGGGAGGGGYAGGGGGGYTGGGGGNDFIWGNTSATTGPVAGSTNSWGGGGGGGSFYSGSLVSRTTGANGDTDNTTDQHGYITIQ